MSTTPSRLQSAKHPEDVFGVLTGTKVAQLASLAQLFRSMAREVHPDLHGGEVRFKLLFQQLNDWNTQAEKKIEAGIYGDRKVAVEPPKPVLEPQLVKTPKGTYTITGVATHGFLADFYHASFLPKGSTTVVEKVIVKIAQSASDNDLMENESKVLGSIYPSTQVSEKYYRLLPRLRDTFVLRASKGGANRRVNIFEPAQGYFSIADIIRQYPAGLDYRDMVWQFKRLLMALGFVHRAKKVVHGAIVPSHVLVHPVDHGALLVDWCYAVSDEKSTIKAIVKDYRAFYPPEVLEKQPPSPSTDIYMAAKCALALVGGDPATNRMPASVPVQLQAFLKGCLIPARARRPGDAWDLHDEFDALLLKLVGKRTYRPLAMPARS